MKKPEELYLEEDKDLIKRLHSIETPISTGTTLEERRQELEVLQIESLLRTRKASRDAEKSTNRFSFVIFFLTMTQLLVALYQLLFSVVLEKEVGFKVFGFSLIVVIITFLVVGMKYIDKNLL